MSDVVQLRPLILLLLAEVPLIIMSLVGCVVTLVRWKQGSRGSIWAFTGFALATMLFSIGNVFLSIIGQWVIKTCDEEMIEVNHLTISFAWSAINAIPYALLLVAIFAGRSLAQPASSPSSNPNEKNPYVS